MRVQIAKSWDFNQMLVASVFGHLLLMTFVIFLPKSTYEEIVITPAFMVELIDIPKNQRKAAQIPVHKKTPQKKIIPAPLNNPKPTSVKSVVPPKQIEQIRQTIKMPPEPKAHLVPPDKSKQMLEQLNQLNDKSSGGLVQELDQLAKLVPKVSLKRPVIKKSKPIHEQTFDELKALKNKKVEFNPNHVEPLPVEDPLAQFEKLKMQEELEVKSSLPESVAEKKIDTSLEELKFASISRNTVELKKKQDEKSAEDLFRELTNLESQPPEIQKKEIIAPPVVQEESRAFDSIIQKLESLNQKPEDINTDIVASKSFSKEFKSDIRKVSVPKQVHVEVVVSSSKAFVQSLNQGEPSANPLALYKGLIIKKVYGNWHDPLGQDVDNKVVVSFYIYPKGNIDRPNLKKSSKVELLDNLALRAILKSEPFPPFPKEIKSSNLNISITFKYTSEKG